MKFLKQTRVTETGEKEYLVRLHGGNIYISQEDFEKEVLNGNIYFKANYPVRPVDVKKY